MRAVVALLAASSVLVAEAWPVQVTAAPFSFSGWPFQSTAAPFNPAPPVANGNAFSGGNFGSQGFTNNQAGSGVNSFNGGNFNNGGVANNQFGAANSFSGGNFNNGPFSNNQGGGVSAFSGGNFNNFNGGFGNNGGSFNFNGGFGGSFKTIRPSGQRTTQSKSPPGPFNRLTISVSGTAVISPGSGPITISGDSAVVAAVTLRSRRPQSLEIGLDGNCQSSFSNPNACSLDLRIPASNLANLTLNGASEIDLRPGVASTVGFGVEANGASTLRGSVNTGALIFMINGAADVTLDGMVQRSIICHVNGAGTLDLSRMQASSASGEVDMNGAGDVAMPELASLRTQRNGAGSVTYRGNPRLESHGSFEWMPGANGRDPAVRQVP